MTPAHDAANPGPHILAGPGTMPAPRSGNVAYVANLSAMFFDNEELTDELRQCVRSLSSYGGRLLPILCLRWDGDHNLLILERKPLAVLHDYFGSELKLRLPEVRTFTPGQPLSTELEAEIRATPSIHLDGFVTDQHLTAIADRTQARLAGSFEGSRLGNDKLLLHRFLRDSGELVFESIEAASPAEVAAAAADLARRGYRFAAAKSAIGASGIGLVRFPTATPPAIPPSHFVHGPCLIEGWLDPNVRRISRVASPSVQMVVSEDTIHLYDLTDQILGDDSVHEGNISPPRSFHDPSLEEELMRQAGVVGRWLHAQGYRGTASTDFHLAFLHSGEIEVRVCETNARVTGATYPSLLARHFQPQGTWLMRNLRLPDPLPGALILDNLAKADLLYQPGKEGGVLPINFNLEDDGRVGKGQYLFLGPNPLAVEDLIDRTLSLDHLLFDRD